MTTETQTFSGTISMKEFAKGSRSESVRPALTLDDGSVLWVRVAGANPFQDRAVNAAVGLVEERTNGRVNGLEGQVYNGALFIKDPETLLQAAGLKEEGKRIWRKMDAGMHSAWADDAQTSFRAFVSLTEPATAEQVESFAELGVNLRVGSTIGTATLTRDDVEALCELDVVSGIQAGQQARPHGSSVNGGAGVRPAIRGR